MSFWVRFDNWGAAANMLAMDARRKLGPARVSGDRTARQRDR